MGRCVPQFVNFEICLPGLMQIRQGFDGTDLSKCAGRDTSHLAIGVMLQAIQQCRHHTRVADTAVTQDGACDESYAGELGI